ncbi:MAG TPA: anti-sigma factor [Thermoanaerobaculia bacterium]|nr:anti-sigma factor [Thermoanaerobaculia bacterium]
MNDAIDREDEAILATLDILEARNPDEALQELSPTPPGPWGAPEAADVDETLRRLYVETLGLLGSAPEPVVPRAGSRARLLAALGAGPRPVAERREPPAEAAPPAVPAEEVAEPPRPAAPEPVPPPARPRSGLRPALWALAAVLLLALGAAGWLYRELQGARSELARLDEERSRLSERLSRQEGLIRQGGQAGEVIAAVATPGVEVCPLHPVGDPPFAPEAYAVLYMPPGSGKWYLLASNLEPAEGVYVVWLDTPGGALPAGVLAAGEESVLELDPARLGDLTGLTSITVTMEPSPDMPEPRGPRVLYGDEKMTVL